MNRFMLFFVAMVGCLASGAQCKPEEQLSVADLEGSLKSTLIFVEPKYLREVEAFVAGVEQAPATAGPFHETMKKAAIVYRDSKGAEALKTERKRVQLFDILEAACDDFLLNIGQFNKMHSVSQAVLDKSSYLAKWYQAADVCSSFVETCTWSAVSDEAEELDAIQEPESLRARDCYNESRGIDEFAYKKQSKLGKIFNRRQ